jgi:hypothetical protein
MNYPDIVRRPAFLIFCAVFAVGLTWALYTNHAWEDYYITYRASKNLATGRGLTFTEGERVHSFTSPLGVLLPAAASLLTGNRSDDGALWIFRIVSLCAYAGAGVVLWRLARVIHGSRLAAGLLVMLFAVDTKIVDFSINGMETGILMLFLAWTLSALITSPAKQSLQLGAAWAGLMWTRPDSCIYIAALAVGALLFCPPTPTAGGRWGLLKTFFAASAIAAALYLPWLLWAWGYYGSPVPNTITAKGLFHPSITPASLAQAVWAFPGVITAHRDMLATTFMPAYSVNTGWPRAMVEVTYWIALGCMIVWVLPGVRRETRLVSFVFGVGEFYLGTFVMFPVPWYIPTLTVFSLLVITGLIDQGIGFANECAIGNRIRSEWITLTRGLIWGVSILLFAGSLAIALLAAYQLRHQQALIEQGERRQIGLWLREHAASVHDTVFLEPLGYIGFYSNLKMFDYPGLSSPEVIAARKRSSNRSYPECWPALILDLCPNWLVLRSYEADAIRKENPEILGKFYTLAKAFDVRPQVNALPFIMGRGYLTNDAYFEVYHRNLNITRDGIPVGRIRPITAAMLEKNQSWGQPAYDSGENLVTLAPSHLSIRKPVGARWLSGGLGIFEGAYADPKNSTDGAVFSIYLSAGPASPRRELLHRFLNPRDVMSDRGLQSFYVRLPTTAAGVIEFEISPGPHGNNAYDWTYWSRLTFEFANQN